MLAAANSSIDVQAGVQVDVRPVVAHGHPAQVLLPYARRADLLVSGSRGHGALSRLTLGSVSTYCAEHARCPVMVVKEHEAVTG
ncbi:universal stress protein [Planobispora siamensis]|uniref:UspA domain-containing protein n=1 Tax=Planobispora siamensis TaxID=936338 RepID=A0A8J3WQH4_9ACTN|nr:universal stress protein [Planobispora siamensis]GIH95791.1 hypothetical protein Psi01_64210 [Planobispora siamensis]